MGLVPEEIRELHSFAINPGYSPPAFLFSLHIYLFLTFICWHYQLWLLWLFTGRTDSSHLPWVWRERQCGHAVLPCTQMTNSHSIPVQLAPTLPGTSTLMQTTSFSGHHVSIQKGFWRRSRLKIRLSFSQASFYLSCSRNQPLPLLRVFCCHSYTVCGEEVGWFPPLLNILFRVSLLSSFLPSFFLSFHPSCFVMHLTLIHCFSPVQVETCCCLSPQTLPRCLCHWQRLNPL